MNARCLAASSWRRWLLSEKFDFRSQPVAEVLSPWTSKQDPGGTRPARSSIQTEMIPPRNSKRFSEIPSRHPTLQSGGNSSRHALPFSPQNPPIPCSAASDRNTCVGTRKEMRLRLIPWNASRRKNSQRRRSARTCGRSPIFLPALALVSSQWSRLMKCRASGIMKQT
jgi:hypothetical protein